MIRFYDLAGADPARRFSPYCWRVRMALMHKGLEFETMPWRFTDRAAIAWTGHGAVPILVDDDQVVADSFTIAEHLDRTRPERPLLCGEAGRRYARFMKHWTETQLHPLVARMIVIDILDRLDERDRPYFRESREQRWGGPLEQLVADREGTRAAFTRALAPARSVASEQPYLGGEAPDLADYILFGVFMWARCGSSFPVLVSDDPVAAWRDRMLSLHGGYAASFPAG